MATKPVTTSEQPLQIGYFERQRDWAAWLKKNHASSPGLWLKFAKKGAGAMSVSYDEAIEIALCHGWIDGQKKALDEQFWLQRFTRRSAKSIWSKINKDKALALVDAGKMAAAGLAEIERARHDGRWDAAYDGARRSVVPDDLAAALDANPRARDFFATLDKTNRYSVLFRVQTAVKPETRARRIAQLVQMLARHEKFHP
ncbi:YdeI/OmpD-associated family protein [Dokdonella soli]|uniref:YdeI/OmpD-associated family protein n=1 Tax=Dokdonella soli TaxID=529810 RepID=A0ABN1IZG3_9GAMM